MKTTVNVIYSLVLDNFYLDFKNLFSIVTYEILWALKDFQQVFELGSTVIYFVYIT